MTRTASLWGEPPSRYYRFLRRVRKETTGQTPSLTVLGCADGKFVVPAARQGLRVVAIDVDDVALFGGHKPGLTGDVYMPGLAARLRTEGLTDRVSVVHENFMSLPAHESDAVFASGAFQYSFNSTHTAEELLEAAMQFVAPRGLFYVDYMLPFEAKYKGRPNCPDADWWRTKIANLRGWDVLHHRVLPPVPDIPHVEYPEPHSHQWGHLFLRRQC